MSREHHWFQGHTGRAAQPWQGFCRAPHPVEALLPAPSPKHTAQSFHVLDGGALISWYIRFPEQTNKQIGKNQTKPQTKSLDTMVRYPLWEIFA